MINKYTPDPWTIRDTRRTTAHDRFVIECETNVPNVPGKVATVGYLPNARIIANAPKLLGMLEQIYAAMVGNGKWPKESEIWQLIFQSGCS